MKWFCTWNSIYFCFVFARLEGKGKAAKAWGVWIWSVFECDVRFFAFFISKVFFEWLFISYILRFILWSRYSCSCLWLDERCIFTVARLVFHGVNLSMYEIKTSHHGDCLNNFYLRVGMHKKTPSFVFFFLMHRNSWIKVFRAHYP